MARIFIKTWGCTLNQSDSDIMHAILESEGHELCRSEKGAELVVLNTCTVKGATESRIISELARLKERGAKVVVAGCLSANRKRISRVAPEAPIVGAGATGKIAEAVRLALQGKGRGAFFDACSCKFLLPRRLGSPIARIPIGEGCVSRCAFCQSRIARPKLMSYPPREVVRLVEQALAGGAREIQLTGMDTGAYGFDIKSDLVSLLEELVKVEGDFKIRLGMINPQHARRMEGGLAGIFRSQKMFRFLHIPVQSGSERVCREMGRGHTVADFEHAVAAFRKGMPDLTLATDVIAAYPTETGEDFRKTLELIGRVRPDMVNISRFTPRPGTEAKKLKQMRSEDGKKRTALTHALARKIACENALAFLGKRMRVLINEKGRAGQVKGRADNYRQVAIPAGRGLMGKRVLVEIEETSNATLIGRTVR
ncbi:tRNA-2-methylthio-N(6)-dimethylallyladenosine synthase [uncultured archaeon]|nr:tRNA-2-methylthio-N(6)-dimethylallyladenosine synthase [uncultured archaeon]